MAFAEVMNTMREDLQRALDQLTSARSSLRSKTQALQNLERTLAAASFGVDSQDVKDAFVALQHTFECNVPSRLLPWIMATTSRLETLTNINHKGQEDDGKSSELDDLSSQLAVSLTIIQGVALNHEASKTFMGRKPFLEILLDLLLTSRHLTIGIGTSGTGEPQSSPTKGAGSSSPVAPQPPLTSLVLDTLLCILVDSSPALRAFEEANGVQSIVKILKRAGTPREVRMKCLEFLYFYLLDETPDPSSLSLLNNLKTPPPTAPTTPVRSSLSSSPSLDVFPNAKQKPYMNATPLRPSSMSRYGSSTFSFSSSAASSTSTMSNSTNTSASTSTRDGNRLSTSASSLASVSTSSRSTSGSSIYSFSSTSSNASSETAASSMPASPVKETFSTSQTVLDKVNSKSNVTSDLRVKSPVKRAAVSSGSGTPSTRPTSLSGNGNSNNSGSGLRRNVTPILPRSLMMLRKEVEFVPLSPKKSPQPSPTTSSTSTPSSASTLNASPAPRISSTEQRGDTPLRTKLVPRSGSGSGTSLRPQVRSAHLGHRKSLSTSTLGTGSGLSSPGAGGPGVFAAVAKARKEDSLPKIPLGKRSVTCGAGAGGEDTDVDGDDHGEVDISVDVEKDAIVINRYRCVLSSSASSNSSSTSTPSSSSNSKEKEKENDRYGYKEKDNERKWKTTEEKRELLGTMLGNVDALVEGVRKAGIWGLG